MKYAQLPVDDEGWTEWYLVGAGGHKERCCDCKLVHDVEVQVRSNRKPRRGEAVSVFIRVRRNERATAASRRGGKYAKTEACEDPNCGHLRVAREAAAAAGKDA